MIPPIITENLCSYDSRNSVSYSDLSACLDPEDMPEPRGKCACDNCFYGRDKMALVMLEMFEALSGLYNAIERNAPKINININPEMCKASAAISRAQGGNSP